MDDQEVRKRAQELIDGIRSAIDEGVKHYDKQHRLLSTVKDVLNALKRDGEVEIVPPQFKQVSNVIHIPRNKHGRTTTNK